MIDRFNSEIDKTLKDYLYTLKKFANEFLCQIVPINTNLSKMPI